MANRYVLRIDPVAVSHLGTISDFGIDSVGDATAVASWTPPTGATAIQPQRRLTGGGAWSDFGPPLAGDAVGVTYTGLVNGTSYDFRAVAFGGTSEATYSNIDTGTPETGYATPDILNNASFESGWDGFTNSGGSPPSGNVVRSTDQAYSGSYSVKASWTQNAGTDEGALCIYDVGSGLTTFNTRFWYYFTARPGTIGFKFVRYQDVGFNEMPGGLQLESGSNAWLWCIDPTASFADFGTGPEIGGWHWFEYEWDTVNKTVKFWHDGTQIGGSGTVGEITWSGLVAHYTGNYTPRNMDVFRIINGSPGYPTNSGSAYIDRIAVSSLGRIGP